MQEMQFTIATIHKNVINKQPPDRSLFLKAYFYEREKILRDWPSVIICLQLTFFYACSEIAEDVISQLFGLQISLVFSLDPDFPQLATTWISNGARTQTFVFRSFSGLDYHGTVLVDRWLQTMNLFSEVVNSGPFHGAVIVNFDDCGNGHGLNACDYIRPEALIPDTYFLGSRGYEEARLYFEGHSEDWFERSNVVFWRGSTTGRKADGDLHLPRIALCLLAKEQQSFDCKITEIVQSDKKQSNFVNHSDIMGPFVSWKELSKYKYHIDIDGNTNSFPGLFLKLLCGGLVFKVISPNRYQQWYYDRLIDGKNFVAIRSDMKDLVEKIQFYIENEAKAKSIAEHGRQLARTMTYESEMQWGVERIQKYASVRA